MERFVYWFCEGRCEGLKFLIRMGFFFVFSVMACKSTLKHTCLPPVYRRILLKGSIQIID